MSPDGAVQLGVLFVLLALSSFFSASETALMSLSRIQVRHMVEENVKGADVVSRLLDNPSKLLGAILVGNNIVNIGASALATSLAINYFGSGGVGIATAIMTFLVLIFGEITPKSLAAENSEKVALRVSGSIALLTRILSPVIALLMSLTNGIIRFFGGEVDKVKPFITQEELRTMVHVSHEEGVLEGEEKTMIYNVFEFGNSQVKDVMTPRTDMVAVELDSPFEVIISVFKEEQFSRIPVYKEVTDNIVGVLYIKDLFFYDKEGKDFNISAYMREPYFTFELKKTDDLFNELRHKRIPMAIVLDEYGGTAGIVTMEDLVEEIVGDIHDEYDEHKKEIERIKENEFLVDGAAKIDLVNQVLGIHIETEDFDSIGGFVVGEFGRLPKVGEMKEYKNLRFIVENIDRNRIDKLRIVK